MAELQLKIIASPADNVGQVFTVTSDNDATVLGRTGDNGIPIKDRKVSRQHARLSWREDELWVDDLDSTYGTFVNDATVEGKPCVLKPGDHLRVGTTVLELAAASADLPEEPSPAAPSAPAPSASSGPSNTFKNLQVLYEESTLELKKRIHEQILRKLNLSENAGRQIADGDIDLKDQVEGALDEILRLCRHEIPQDLTLDAFRGALLDDIVALGPITPLLNDDSVSEIMVNGPDLVFVERDGHIVETGCRFNDNSHVMNVIQRIVEPLGRRVDDASPMVDARLPDGSRVNAIISPLALDGASITIRKFATRTLTSDDLVNYGSLTPDMALFLKESVRARQNILISGGTGSGKTTLLNIMSLFIPSDERLVTVEDSAELKLTHRNLVRLETRPPNIEGKGRVAIRDLVINCLRMRPDRIIVGECRGSEALDMLQAMNTGHDGSMTTIHANTPRDSIMRLENMVMMAGYDLPSTAIREQISSALNIIVQQTRMVDGTRKIVKITEVTGREGSTVMTQDIFSYEQSGFTDDGKVIGEFVPTGNIPRFVDELRLKGDLRLDMQIFHPNP